jgi:hypothetical protein
MLFAKDTTPKPQFEYWFEGQGQELLFGNNKYTHVMDKHVHMGCKVRGNCCWKHFGQYFTLLDFRDNSKESQQANPLWKVQTLLDKLNKQASSMWLPGKFVNIEEQTIDFQGSSSLKIRILYKHKGNGFHKKHWGGGHKPIF